MKSVKPDNLNHLAEKEKQIRGFVENLMMDECGLILSFMNRRTIKPWTNEELKKYDRLEPFCHGHVANPAEYYSYENSLMATGEYGLSQVVRFETTGDGEALAAAAHPVYAILRVLYQGELYEKGFLPKPFGGIRKCAYSHEISPDQYIKSCVALMAYGRHAPAPVQNIINDYMVNIADYHQARNFIHPRRESFVVTPENRPHVISIFIPMLCIAYKITGKKKYKEALKRFDAIMDDYAEGKAEFGFNLCSLVIEGLHLACQNGLEDSRVPIIIKKLWCMTSGLLLGNGLGYITPDKKAKTSESLRMAGLAAIVDHYHPEIEAWKTGVFLLKKNTDPKKMLYVNEADEKIGGHTPLPECLCELAITSWLLGYWRLKQELCGQHE